jgi:hypothetical protein
MVAVGHVNENVGRANIAAQAAVAGPALVKPQPKAVEQAPNKAAGKEEAKENALIPAAGVAGAKAAALAQGIHSPHDIRLIEPVATMRLFASDELKVGKELGAGSFKKAYRCDWNGTPVVKVAFHMENQNQKEAEKNFREELAVVARLVHPNIVQFLGRCQGELAFIIAHCANGSLFDVLFDPSKRAVKEKLTEAHRFHIALGVTRALNFLHHCVPPVLHRDLKGSNVLLTENFDAMVSDFGLTLMKLKAHGISKHKGEGTANYMYA